MTEPQTTDPPHDTQAPPPSPPTRHGPSLWMLGIVLIVAGGALTVGVLWADALRAGAQRIETLLLAHEHEHQHEQSNQYYTCGMHPWVVLPSPGDCPVCHMAMTPLDPAKFANEIQIDPRIVQSIGVRTTVAERGPVQRTVRAVGDVTYNEQAVRNVNTRIDGWIQTLHVDQTGTRVKRGDPLFDVYSPKLYAAQREYLAARRRSGSDDVDLVDAARSRLVNLGISDAQIDRLRDTGEPADTMTIHSPHAGVVTEKHASEGMRITPGMRVYEIADLSTVWVMVSVYESDLPFVEVGQRATVTLPFLPGETFTGRVDHVYPYMQPRTRAVRVRLALANPDGRLKPGMYATVRLQHTKDNQATLVPRDAVVGTGERSVVFVSLGGGKFEPRDVKTGAQTTGGMIAVNGGVQPGEHVVTSGQFLLDSESKMRSALAKMTTGNLASEQPPAPPEAGGEQPAATRPAALNASQQKQLDAIVSAYLNMQQKLADDTLDGIDAELDTIRQAARRLAEIGGDPLHQRAADTADQATRHATKLDAIKPARNAFGDLSAAVIALAEVAPPGDDVTDTLYVAHCPTAEADWLQTTTDIVNPYMGKMMLRCGSLTRTIKHQTNAQSTQATTQPAEKSTP